MGHEEIRIPPQNIAAEKSVLGSMLIDEDAIGIAVEILNETLFYDDAHRKIYKAIIDLYNSRKNVDLITLSDNLKSDGFLEDIGGVAYLSTIVDFVPTSANVEHYAQIVKEKGILRKLIKNSTQIVTECFSATGKVEDVVDNAERLIFEIAELKQNQQSYQIKDLIKEGMENLDKLYQRKEHITGVASGFDKIDKMTSGLQKSDLIIVAGRPSMGKSALAVSIAENVSIIGGKNVAIFSLEMSKEQLVQRMLCSQARVDAHKVRSGFLSPSDWPKLTSAAAKLSGSKIFIDDTPAISALELRAKSRRLKANYGLDLIILDYLQLMRGSIKSDSRQQEISEISRSLKALARELSVPFIALSQLSRAVEARQDHRPQLSDLRESGAIEQDADVVVLLMREEYYNPTEENRGIADVIIAKQRNGPVGTIKLQFTKEYMRFENLAHVD
ncbi:MAG: replicative DNA helicase [Omnitrophica WOR_2 bacterium GWF2_38_59]|nr:MAG: replicative DNA helicase [Omnitrophica WOR_2 bacterium GWF2_38_59]OGX49754.1 MAG: replicative DNA helicase [Omnitrophica WOR_2 bacterium RIFOXYA2_FULL_38_17]OGX54654.1 MAG: replicative DNA helicase [Omnitrophica WOR_2 bacterium RIFOXYA12_FULL_38_10]OGX55658.1 MAG: replicative DNA helicase [Omnitrophica WOR_2 bacterium RIFOXYC2_FULL_38_12]OGX60102.1 MAG: replicative DNA helicase [Omnitrophica WOR_2 bacterium RIFOXYB2_FULL_38_16]HBG61418.1 replicative DNA helicase [Candidatus Omnitrophot